MGRRGPQPVGPATVRREPRARATSVGGLDSGAWKGTVAQFPRGRRRRREPAMAVEQRVSSVSSERGLQPPVWWTRRLMRLGWPILDQDHPSWTRHEPGPKAPSSRRITMAKGLEGVKDSRRVKA